jgi:N-acyl homoserine lactone hydrolase
VRLYLLSGGLLDAKRSVIHPGDDSGKRVTIPVMQVLMQGNGQTILVDTGVPVVAAGDRAGLQREYGIDPAWIDPRIAADERVDAQLAKLGLQPSDLDLVINTHFHFDHAGGNALFAGVPIAVQAAELEAAQEDDAMPWWDAPGLQFRPVRGDWSPLPGIDMLHTPGHTPGHQSMLVRIGTQPILFTWDAVYTEEHWREGKLGPVHDIPASRASIRRLRQIAVEANARVIFGHDIVQWSALMGGSSGEPVLLAANE